VADSGGAAPARERVNRGLTQLDSNFCIETQKTVNIKVVGNSKIYNFRVGKNFIRVMV
jgi:hypothetical protein